MANPCIGQLAGISAEYGPTTCKPVKPGLCANLVLNREAALCRLRPAVAAGSAHPRPGNDSAPAETCGGACSGRWATSLAGCPLHLVRPRADVPRRGSPLAAVRPDQEYRGPRRRAV